MSVVAASFSTSPLWYTTRSTGIIAFVLFTITTILGLVATQRQLATRSWPRFATQALHRNASLLGVVFLAVHVVTTILDSYVDVSWWSAIIPFTSSYDRYRVALGTIASDTLLLVIITSLVRTRIPEKVWRYVHWAAYGLWPMALLHFISEGTDGSLALGSPASPKWGFWLGMVCLVLVSAAAVARWTLGNAPAGPVRSVAGASRGARR